MAEQSTVFHRVSLVPAVSRSTTFGLTEERPLLNQIARMAITSPRRVIVVAALLTLALAIFGVPVANSLSASGFQDPTSESARASQLLTDKFSRGDTQLLVTVSTPDGVDSPAARAAGTEIVDQLRSSPHVVDVASPWSTPPQAAADLVSSGRHTGLIVAGIKGNESDQQKYADELSKQVTHDRNGATVRTGGAAMVNVQITKQSQHDLLVMESIAIPLSFLVLVWVFGGLIAAALPVAVGGMAIFGALAVLRTISFATDVSIFALNLTTAMGLALAIDYTLLMISRYRDELADGADREVAVVRTVVTAGRTVLFSATTVALSMAVMMLFPMHFLKSFAYAGVAVVAFAAFAAVVVTPAALVLLGDRLDSFNVRRLVRRLLGRAEPAPQTFQQQFWYRWTRFVIRRAVPVGLAGVAFLVFLGLPFLSVKWGFPDDRVLPTSASAHQLGDQMRDDFAIDSETAVTVVIPDTDNLTRVEIERYAIDLSRVPDVSAVSSPTATYVAGTAVGRQSAPAGQTQGSAFLTVDSSAPLFSDRSETQSRPSARGPDPGWQGSGFHRHRSAQSRQCRCHRITFAIGARADRLHHVHPAVPVDGQRRDASESVGAQRPFAHCSIRRDGVDLPGWAPRRVRHDAQRDLGRQHPGAAVLYRIRLVDGLRGVPGLPNPRVLAGFRSRRQRRECGPGNRPHRSGRYRCRVDHVDLLRRADCVQRVVHADVRAWPHAGRPGRRHFGANGFGAGIHAPPGTTELVGSRAPCPPAQASRAQRR